MASLKDLIYFKITGAIENTVFSDIKSNQEIPESMIYFLQTTKNNCNGYVNHDGKMWKYFDNVRSPLSHIMQINDSNDNIDIFYIDLYVIYAFTTVVKFYFPNVFRGLSVSHEFLEFYYVNKSNNINYLKNTYTDSEIFYIRTVILPFIEGICKYCNILVIFNNQETCNTPDNKNIDTLVLTDKTDLENVTTSINHEKCVDVKFLNTINDSKIRRIKIQGYQKLDSHIIKEWTFIKIDNEYKFIQNERYERFSSMNSEIPLIDFSQINMLSTIHIVSASEKSSSDIYVNISSEFDEIVLFSVHLSDSNIDILHTVGI